MKAKYLFGALALAALGMTSCSNDEPNVDPVVDYDGEGYMYVRLTSVGNNGSRAENTDLTDEDFEGGVGTENDLIADNVRFYFFDAMGNPFTLAAANVDGTVSNTNMVQPLYITVNTTNGNTTGVADGMLVLGKATGPYVGTTPSQVVCVANLSAAKMASMANISLDKMQEVTQNVADASFTKFGMSSSTYASNNKEVFAADVTGKIASDPTTAKKAPVDIYIERLAVKLRVTNLGDKVVYKDADSETVATYEFVDPSGNVEEKTLKVDLTGWQVRNEYDKCKVIKDLGDVTALDEAFPGFLWNAEAYHRSFWAVTPNVVDNIINSTTTFDIYDATQFTLKNFDEATPTKNIKYVYPNTAWWNVPSTNDLAGNWGKPLSNRQSNATAIVIRGVVHLDGETEGLDMVRWGGQYHTLDDFKQIVANTFNNDVDYAEVGTIRETQVSLQQLANKNLYVAAIKTVDGEGVTKTIVYNRITNIEYWKDGVTSYYINIQHDSYLKDGVLTPIFGVVRNHIYDTDIEKVIGLGIPGNVIENHDKETETYLAARINVLNWKVVANTIVLE